MSKTLFGWHPFVMIGYFGMIISLFSSFVIIFLFNLQSSALEVGIPFVCVGIVFALLMFVGFMYPT